MLFNSFAFIGFFAATFGVVHSLPVKNRWIALLIASYIFYAYAGIGLAVLLLSFTFVQYCAALCIANQQTLRRKKLFLVVSIAIAVLFLGFFKYAGFFQFEGIVLPMGISFYTFQILAYIIDVYRGDIKPEKHFARFAVFVSFFPQLIAGPIERAKDLMPQLQKPEKFDYLTAVSGLQLLLWGFFKKLVIADHISLLIDRFFLKPELVVGWHIPIIAILFFFQIYCDFSGYVDIAIGSARLLGIKLSQNFNLPYLSISVRDFWHRWHITLSQWFKDYLYIPLGGNRVAWWRWYANILIIFFISGLWHGANWTFVLWGLLHGIWICLEVTVAKIYNFVFQKVRFMHTVLFVRIIPWCITMLFICYSFLLFRSESLELFFDLFREPFRLQMWQITYFHNTDIKAFDMNVVLSAIAFLLCYEMYIAKRHVPLKLQWVLVTLFLMCICNFGIAQEKEFIYFRF